MDDPQNDAEAADARPREPAAPRLEALLRRSAAAILAERLWRAGLALLTLALLFLALSWLDLWRVAPPFARIAGVAIFGCAALFIIVRELAAGLPRRRAALTRLDAAADPSLRPAQSLDDRLAAQNADDESTAALWALHRRRLEAALARTPVAAPDPQTPRRDPYALRALALVAAIAAAFIAGDERRARLMAAFDWRALPSLSAGRIDAWLEPPAYTGRAPIVLSEARASAIEAPVNSILRVRPADASITVSGALTREETPTGGQGAPANLQAYRLTGAARISLPDGRDVDVAAIPDRAPTIALVGKPLNNVRGAMTLAFKAEDDYGVVSAEAVFARPPGGRRTLYEPPRLPLSLPPGAAGQGEGKATIDLADSPYAGARLTMRLVAKDAADNEGASAPAEVTLPQRRFTKPLARALVEQRRNLALDPEARANVRAALEALALAPETFDTPSSIHLGLRAALRSLDGRRSDDELRAVADMLWAMALSLEGGDMQAERDLRAAEQELREAMQRGDEDEIAQKSQALREALDKFLQQLGARLPKEGEPPREASPDGDTVTPEDLQAMLDEMNKAMQSGDMAQAQKLLDELQDILENAQTPDAQSAQSNAQRQKMQRALSELDQLSREEQKLRDETFQGMKRPEEAESDGLRRRLPPGARPGEESAAERQRQQALRERLERQQDALQQEGAEASEDLNEARKAMKEAEQALNKNGEGRGKAVEAQGRAVDSLRKGAEKLAQQMREGDDGEGQGGQRGRRRSAKGRDPLGRGSNGRGSSAHNRYDPLGLPPAQRAHRVQEELRRRLGQPERPQDELDYLQRLLKR